VSRSLLGFGGGLVNLGSEIYNNLGGGTVNMIRRMANWSIGELYAIIVIINHFSPNFREI